MIASLTGYHGYVGKNIYSSNPHKKELQTLSSLLNGEDFADVCEDYFKLITSLVSLEDEQKAFQGAFHKREGRLLWGLIESGGFGYGSTLKNRRTGKNSYQRVTDDVELLPHAYMLYIPSGYKECILVLQKNGIMGIKSVLTDAIIEKFNNDHMADEIKLGFKPYLDAKVFYEYLSEGEIKALRFIKTTLPTDIADRVRNKGGKEEQGIAEMKFTRFPERTLKKILGDDILNRLRNNESTAGLAKIDIGFDYDSIKLELSKKTSAGNKRKVFDLIDTDGFIESRDIVPDKNEYENGLPTFKCACINAFAYLEELCNNLDIQKPNKPQEF
mgnify:CR=1 FL=1